MLYILDLSFLFCLPNTSRCTDLALGGGLLTQVLFVSEGSIANPLGYILVPERRPPATGNDIVIAIIITHLSLCFENNKNQDIRYMSTIQNPIWDNKIDFYIQRDEIEVLISFFNLSCTDLYFGLCNKSY